ncbi:uncharacterized protein LOC111465733 [Cucurbita maxima]|uniref:Uncharacterized protein LOC111465733 n=1 Tax=Cucurbita maxima TaxID=3661 RepID=A0A6J1HN87_CUCMA|nr:uncharacterized protein LOC111465733 [Cucurbita maxima]
MDGGGLFCGVDEDGERSDCGGGMVGVLVDGVVGRGGCGGDGGGSDGGDDGCSFVVVKLLCLVVDGAKQVRGYLIKAQEHCGRAISTKPNDRIVLSMYANLIWKNRKNAS